MNASSGKTKLNREFVGDQTELGFNLGMSNPIGKIITTRLRELKKTQGWLAEQCGVSDTAVHKWIHAGQISRDNALSCALALQISVDQLLGHTAIEEQPAPALERETFLERVNVAELRLLSRYREATAMGRELIDAAVEHAPREGSGPSQKKGGHHH
jgi:hypothetical protein